MGRFTALDDPQVDQLIAAHMEHIVTRVRSQMEPDSIILRGSFGRGEGSIMPLKHGARFMSDYEIDVATYSPFQRSMLANLSRQITSELDVSTSLRWVRPDLFYKNRIGPIAVGAPEKSISLYELRYGSLTLYGKDLIASAPEFDPTNIHLESGMYLVLNRMAESLFYLAPDNTTHDELQTFYWLNKTILACMEALLLYWKKYHFSYAERGRRFASLAEQRLGFLPDQGAALCGLAAQAIEFKLRPRQALCPISPEETWQQVIPILITVFHYLAEQILGISYCDPVEFPVKYLKRVSDHSALSLSVNFWILKTLEGYRSLRRHSLPHGLLLPYNVTHVVYAVVPLMLESYASSEPAPFFYLIRHWLKLLGPLEPPFSQLSKERDYLRSRLTWYWKVYCHG